MNAAGRHSAESAADLEQVLLDLLDLPVVAAARRLHGTPAGESALLRMTSELTGRFATGAVLATRQAAGDGPLHRYDTDLVVPRLLVAEVAVLKSIAHLYVMQDPVRQELQNQQRRLLAELVEALCRRGRGGAGSRLRGVVRGRRHRRRAAAGGRRPGVAADRRAGVRPAPAVGAARTEPGPGRSTGH